MLQAPSGAVFRSGEHDESWAAYRLDSGRARLVPVEIGHRGADAVEILSGLEEGAPLLLYPGERIRDGSRAACSALRARRASPSATPDSRPDPAWR